MKSSSPQTKKSQKYQNQYPQIGTIQYKNAVYFGQHINNQPHGFGLMIYDSGSFILAQWKYSSIHGKYFLYQNLMLNRSSSYTGCYFGKIISNKLQGFNCVQSIDQNVLQGNFFNGKLQGQFLLEKSNSTIHFLYQQSKLIQQSKVRKYRDRKQSTQQIKQKKDRNAALHFLKSMVLNVKLINTSEQNFITCKDISQHQCYFGALNQSNNQGYGFILRYGWPYISGKLKNYKLQGIGSVYQNHSHFLQGQFVNGNLVYGVLLDFQAKKSHYGYRNLVGQSFSKPKKNKSQTTKSDEESQKFIIRQTLNKINNNQIVQYRRQKHLKSFFFVNTFKTEEDFSYQWPTHLLDKIFHQEIINGLLHHLAPSYISQIQRFPQTSQNRVEKDLLQIFNGNGQQNPNSQRKKKQQTYLKVSQQLSSQLKKSRNIKQSQIKKDQILIQDNQDINQFKQPANHKDNNVYKKLEFMTPDKAKQQIKTRVVKNKTKQSSEKAKSATKKGLDLHKIYSLYLKK